MRRSLFAGLGFLATFAGASLFGSPSMFPIEPKVRRGRGSKSHAPRKRHVFERYHAPNDVDLRPAAEAKRERKRLERLAVRS